MIGCAALRVSLSAVSALGLERIKQPCRSKLGSQSHETFRRFRLGHAATPTLFPMLLDYLDTFS